MQERSVKADEELFIQRLEDLRKRLLNLKISNRLLNTSFGDRTKGQFRIIGTTADRLHEALLGSGLTIRSLPPLQADPADERNPDFQAALDEARLADEEYAVAVKTARDRATATGDADVEEELHKLERMLRDRVREMLGMPRRPQGAQPSLADHARINGIDPSYDLPRTVPESQRPTHIQTLFLPDTMERRVGAVWDLARQHVQETGINTLAVALGFLEWTENTGTKRLHAPLLLLPTRMVRNTKDGVYVYVLRASEELPQINSTLKELLKHNFKIDLPDYSEEASPEAYWAAVRDIIVERLPSWRVRSWVAVGVFPFSKLAMYMDLDPTDGRLREHPLVRTAILGPQDAPSRIPEIDLEDMAVEAEVPLVITDLDSSQHHVVVEAIRGTSLVVKGPPGTGKSQTITAMIAAALAKGETVLFVAEKLAALEMVQKRLSAAGLAPFCLPLHSDQASRAAVIKAFDSRLKLMAGSSSADFDLQLGELRAHRQTIRNYIDAMKTCLGLTGLTVRDVLWEARLRAEQSNLPDGSNIEIPSSDRVTPADLSAAQSRLLMLAEAYEGAFGVNLAASRNAGAIGPSSHPWRGLNKWAATPFDEQDIMSALSAWQAALEHANEAATRLLRLIDCPMPMTSAAAELFRKHAQAISLLVANFGGEGTAYLLQPSPQAEFLSIISIAQRIHDDKQALEREIAVAADPQELRRLADDLDAICLSGPKPTVHHLPAVAKAASNSARKLDSFAACLAKAAIVVGLREVRLKHVGILYRAARLVRSADRSILARSRTEFLEPSAGVNLCAVRDWATRLREAKNTLAKSFDFEGYTASELQRHANAAAQGGLLWFLKKAARAARKTHARLTHGRKVAAAETIAKELLTVAEHISEVQRFQEDPIVRMFLGASPKVTADVDSLEQVLRFANRVRTDLSEPDEDVAAVRTFLLEADVEAIEAFVASMPIRPPSALQLLVRQPDRPLSEIVQEARRRAELAMTAARRVTSIPALRADADAPALRDLATRLERLHTAEEKLQARAQGLGPLATGIMGRLEDREWLSNAERLLILIPDLPAALVSHIKDATGRMEPILESAKAFADACSNAKRCFAALASVGEIDTAVFLDRASYDGIPISDLQARAKSCAEPCALTAWISWQRARQELANIGLGHFTDSALAMGIEPARLSRVYLAVLRQSQARAAFAQYPELRQLSGKTVDQAKSAFREIDRKIIELSCQKLISMLHNRGEQAPYGNGRGAVKTFTDLALIKHEVFNKTRRHIPTLDLLTRARKAALALKPCFMMSPLSVAQYIDKSVQFDLLVIDEASQMPPEDALGAFARAKRVVVVGDSQQLPPTAFFTRTVGEDGDDDEQITNESILDRATQVFGHPRELRWHYRSRHPSLIEFSNREFYDDALHIPPAAHATDPRYGVVYKYVRGVSRNSVNVEEVAVVVKEAIRFMKARPHESLGIVTMNLEQRELIRSALDRAVAEDRKAQAYVRDWEEQRSGLEPLFVKNLESVQGDERDVIMISMVYGPRVQNGAVKQVFGPVNSVAGHRRLNVLFTRAKNQLILFSSLRPADIIPTEGSHQGVKVLRRYLEFAATGVARSGEDEQKSPESPFEEAVIDCVRSMGFGARPQVGVSHFRVDIGVTHPEYPYGYLLGIECDGSIWHASATARDRDRIRQEVLEGLGWQIYRIWSTEWFRDPVGEARRLRVALAKRLQEARAQVAQASLRDIFDLTEPDHGPAQDDTGATELDGPADDHAAAAADHGEIVTDCLGAEGRTGRFGPARARPPLHLPSSEEPPRRTQTRLSLARPRGPAAEMAPAKPSKAATPPTRRVVKVFDTVTYTLDGPSQARDKPITITITQRTHDPDNGMLAAGHMLVRQMLELEEGEEAEIQVANSTRRLRIEKIVKPDETFAAD